MPLYLHELIHLTLSIVAAFAVFFIYRFAEIPLAYLLMIAVIGGVLIDIDHLIDYFIAYGWKFDLKTFLKGKEFTVNKKIYVLFHGYEYVVLIVATAYFAKNIYIQAYLLTLGISALLHLLADVKLNNVLLKTYSIIYRVQCNFQTKKLTP